ncbi:MAG: aminodeoxychorismate synthase component I [Sedimentisphaerales bacterium]|nr:aminodeoxychorismate synthase component I [Sedimentisphaerales bacterium]
MNLIVEEIGRLPGLGGVLECLKGVGEYFVLGDFSAGGAERFSYLGINPAEVVVFKRGGTGDPFEMLRGCCDKYHLEESGGWPAPFVAGWVGWLGYDLGRFIEHLPDGVVHDIALPLMRFGFYDSIIAWDGEEDKGYLCALEYDRQKISAPQRMARLREIVRAGENGDNSPAWDKPGLKVTVPASEMVGAMELNIARDDYLGKVARAVEYIRAGDIFEVNLSQRFSQPFAGAAGDLYRWLAQYNPADYSALIKGDGFGIVSASPELFLSRRGEKIVTRPIKGTMPRGRNENEDQLNKDKLEHSEKDRAELNMIIDLERNDLGRICRYGSVKVLEERTIETHPTVFHSVATIAGQLWPDTDIARILRATFPGGSISGAPKIRAMEIIDELEPTARSVYTGSIGWIGLDGNFDFNIAIRTIILAGNSAYIQAGGAIVADSEPQAEYDETIAKATALLRAIKATDVSVS